MARVIQGAPYQQDGPDTHRPGDLAEQGKQEAKRLGSLTRSALLQQADERKGEVASTLRGIAESLEQAGEDSGARPVLSKVSGVMRKTSEAIANGSTEELLSSAEQKFRARPGMFLAGLFAAGFIAGRLLKE